MNRFLLFVFIFGLILLSLCDGKINKKSKKKKTKINPKYVNRAIIMKGNFRKWHDCTVPYQLTVKRGKKWMANWKKATAEFLKQTGIKWVPKDASDRHFVRVKDRAGVCFSVVGKSKRKGGQTLNLDRDEAVIVNATNDKNFERHEAHKTLLYATPYDFTSIMHYSLHSGMKARNAAPRNTGNAKTLSKYDKIAVEKHYGCIKNGKLVKSKKRRRGKIPRKSKKKKKGKRRRNRKRKRTSFSY